MSYKSAKRVDVWWKWWAFSKWYIDNTQDLYLQDWASPYLRNARIDWNSTIIRPWHSLFAELTDWDYPRWISRYLQSDSTLDKLIIRHNQDTDKKLVLIDSLANITEIDTSTDIASDNKMTFVNISDVVYCMNWVDDFWKLSWTTYTTPNTWIADFSPSFWVTFNWSLRASWRSDYPNKVYKSVADNYEDFNSAWSDNFTFNETITWLSANNEALFYFTKNSISITWLWDITDTAWTISYVTRSLTVKEGAVNHYSIVEAWNKIYFLTPSNKISIVARWQSIDWFEVLELSERQYKWISNIMYTLDKDQLESFWYFLPKENLIKRFVKTNWSSINDLCIIYDITKDSFLIDSQKFFYDWIFFNWLNYTISNIEPKVYIDEYWQDDEDSPIPFEYHTKELYIWDPTYKKLLRESRTLVDINELAELTQEIYIDWRLVDTKQVDKDNIAIITDWIWTSTIWEQAIWEAEEDDEYTEIYILRTKWALNKKGRKIQYRFINNSLAWKVRLKNLSIKVEELSWLANDLTV